MIIEAWHRLRAMAFSRSDCETKITNLSLPIYKHIVKVLLFNDPVNLHKHTDDLNTWLYEVYEIEPKGFKLKEKDYYTWLWGEKKLANSEPNFLKAVQILRKQYPLPMLDTPENVFVKLPKIYAYIARELAQNEIPVIEDAIKAAE